jgi:thiamine-phosphate pyrophosphorylase
VTRPRLYLVTPQLGDPASFLRELPATLQAGDVAAILLRLAADNERTLINCAKAVAALVQPRGVALLLDGHSEIVAHTGADGAHLSGIDALTAAIGSLKPDRIAGAGGLHSRHDAMLAAEAGADYVMFGAPPPFPPPHAGEGRQRGGQPPFDVIEERIKWWAELIELPCIGYAASGGEVAPLAQAGADFVALGEWVWTDPQGPVAAVHMASTAIRPTDTGTAR